MPDFYDTIQSEEDWKINSVLNPLLKSPNPLPAGTTPAQRIDSELDWKRDQTVNAMVTTAMTNPTPTAFLAPHVRYKTNQTVQNLIDDVADPIRTSLATANQTITTKNQEIGQLQQRVAELEAQVGGANPEPGTRPTGPGYVTYESLGVSNLRDAVNKAGNFTEPVKITFAANAVIVLGPNWGNNTSVVNVPSKVIGFAGVEGAPAKFVYPSGTFPAYDSSVIGTTNPYHSIWACAGTFEEISNITMEGNSGQLHGGIRIQNETKRPILKNFTQKNCAPGDYWTNPRETFGTNIYRCLVGATFINYVCDGRTPAGVDNMASSIGCNSSNDIVIQKADIIGCKYGMPTIWKGKGDITLADVTVEGGHIIFNLENIGGRVTLLRPKGKVFRGTYTTGPGNGKSNLNGVDFTAQSNNTAYVLEWLKIIDAEVDDPARPWGNAVHVMKSEPYPVAGGNSPGGNTQLNTADKIHVYYGKNADGTPKELTPWIYGVSTGTQPTPDKTKNYFVHS